VRYGAFAEQHCLSSTGERVLALVDAEGRLVPDVRGPVFSIPASAQLPSFLEPHLAARNAVTTNDMDYAIETVIQFSNGGGVDLGHDRESDVRVVLKEGRPFAGLDEARRDAVARMQHERNILDRLAGLDVVPEVCDCFELGGHHFLVQEFIDANPLQRLVVKRYPLTRPDPSPDGLREYAEWALGMLATSTETKVSFKTTELIVYVLSVLAVLIASEVIDDGDFNVKEAWFFVTLLTIGYMVSRGLAKSGSRDFYDDRG